MKLRSSGARDRYTHANKFKAGEAPGRRPVGDIPSRARVAESSVEHPLGSPLCIGGGGMQSTSRQRMEVDPRHHPFYGDDATRHRTLRNLHLLMWKL